MVEKKHTECGTSNCCGQCATASKDIEVTLNINNSNNNKNKGK